MRRLCLAAAAWMAAATLIGQELPDLLVSEQILRAKVEGVDELGRLRLAAGDRKLDLRLDAIDFPETGDELREHAYKLLTDRLLGRTVELRLRTPEPGERWAGLALVEGADPRIELVRSGLARYCPRNRREPELELAARSAGGEGVGIWAEGRGGELPACTEAK